VRLWWTHATRYPVFQRPGSARSARRSPRRSARCAGYGWELALLALRHREANELSALLRENGVWLGCRQTIERRGAIASRQWLGDLTCDALQAVLQPLRLLFVLLLSLR